MSNIKDTQGHRFLSEQDRIVFISYSHDSDDHKTKCLQLKIQLLKDGINCIIDHDESFPENGWALWCEKQIERADFVLIVCTNEYTKRFNHDEQAEKGKGVKWEGHIIRQTLYNNQVNNSKFIPVILNETDRIHIPLILNGYTNYLITDPIKYKELYEYITNQSKFSYPPKGNLRKLDAQQISPLFGEHDPLNPGVFIKREPLFSESVRFTWYELKEIIKAIHGYIVVQDNKTIESKFDSSIIDMSKKNELNNMGESYFEDMVQNDDPYSSKIQEFLSNPGNEEINTTYHEVVDELRRKIITIQDEFGSFEKLLQAIYDGVVDNYFNEIKGKKKVVHIVLSYMYLQCDIGRKTYDPSI